MAVNARRSHRSIRHRRGKPSLALVEQQVPHTSQTYEQHVSVLSLEEALGGRSRGGGSSKSKRSAQNLSMAWDDTSLGVPTTVVRNGLLTDRDKKDTHYKVYLGCTWVGACVDVISKRLTSGGWEVEPVESGKGNDTDKERIKQLLLYVNDDEDFLQFLRSVASDLLIFGEAFCELVTGNGGEIVALHKIDCVTMTCHFDKHGQITGYTQELERSTETVEFTTEQIIRWWFPDPRASKLALSPLERMKDAIYLYQSMVTYAEKFFKQGGKPPYWVKLGEDSDVDEARRFIKFYRENYTGLANAHNPPVMYNGAELMQFGTGSVDMDFQMGLNRARDEVLAGYGVPPALVGVIESGNIGGGSGEDQEKSFQFNVVEPIRQLILEKLNFRIKKAFQCPDWNVTTRSANFHSDDVITKVHDIQVRNGTLTINEARQTYGREPVEGGDEAVVASGKEILPVSRLADLNDEQKQAAQLDLDTKKAQVEKLKQPPPPAPIIAPPPGGSAAGNGKQQAPPPKQKKEEEAVILSLPSWLDGVVDESDDGSFFVRAVDPGGTHHRSRSR